MSDWKFEQAEKIFIGVLGGELINVDKHGFSREFKFEIRGNEYRCVWFKNQSTLICGELRTMFHAAEISNTWPSPARAKNKVQFRDERGATVAVIPIEFYDAEVGL